MPSLKAMTKDSPFPPLEKGKMRIYSMRFCPYALRSRLVLEHYKVPYETVNISLDSKPTWYFEKNPFGTVPAYEKDGKILFESRVLCDFIADTYGNGELYPKDPFQKAKAVILMENVGKFTGPYYKLFYSKPDVPQEDLKQYAEQYNKAIQYYEDHLEGSFFNGKTVGMVDYYLWPHFIGVLGLRKSVQLDMMPKDKFPKLNAWVNNMYSTPGAKTHVYSEDEYKIFTDSMRERKGLFDYGLKE